ncbi:MAG: Acyl-CoA dehydrogenase [Syntrophorhabdaceae bacterium PtaU1.Bin034]|jgi:alkylation response protein AidB-like acyl-CoA dehydrogenase|nr:MAG: Acyl-CoA dehydrogenase [Syntrophorhabdaceae bacterium PtaU1.Bin034]
MDFRLSDIQVDIKKAAREFAEGEFTKVAKECDRNEAPPLDLLKKSQGLGFIGVFVDEQYGGMGLGFLETALVMEEFWRVDPGIGSQIMCQAFGAEMLLLYGTEEQKERYLKMVCQGSKIGAVAVTEPDAGSDVLNVSTKAVKQDGGYLINGSKMFISNGDIADFFVTLCLTNPEAEAKNHRHSVIVVDGDRPGIERNKIRGKLGIRAHDTAEITFNNVWVPEKNLIGEEGKGFECFMAFFNRSRTYIAAQGVGVAQGALEMALKHVKKRKVFGKPLAASELVMVRLAELATLIEAARNMTYKAAWKIDQGMADPALTSMAKWYAGEVGVKVVDAALQLHGGYGYIDEYDISRFYRDAKIVEIYEGVKDIEKLVIGRHLIKGQVSF